MFTFRYVAVFVTFASTFLSGVRAQSFAANTNVQCFVLPESPLGTYYYASNDTTDLQVYFSGILGCDPGSYSLVSLYSGDGTFLEDCGYLALDGARHLISWYKPSNLPIRNFH